MLSIQIAASIEASVHSADGKFFAKRFSAEVVLIIEAVTSLHRNFERAYRCFKKSSLNLRLINI